MAASFAYRHSKRNTRQPPTVVQFQFTHYNFVRVHQTLKITPAMASGVASKLWEMSNMVRVLEGSEAPQT